MLNEERVVLMTRMASYEKGEGRKNVKIGNYFRSDYIAVQVLKAVICATVAFAIVFALYVLYDFEFFMQNLYKMDELLALIRNVLIFYAGSVTVYALLTYVICTYRYAKAKNSLKCYYQNLKKLNTLYGGEPVRKGGKKPKKRAVGGHK